MKRLLVGIAFCLLASPVLACDWNFDEVISTFDPSLKVKILDQKDIPDAIAGAEKITGQKYEGVTRAFIVTDGVHANLGLEVGGCLLSAIELAAPPAI